MPESSLEATGYSIGKLRGPMYENEKEFGGPGSGPQKGSGSVHDKYTAHIWNKADKGYRMDMLVGSGVSGVQNLAGKSYENLPSSVKDSIRMKAPPGFGEKNHAALELKDIKGVEVFAVGEWNGDKYNSKDLDSMVSAFAETKERLKPYLKLGHSDDQALLAADSLPAAGWVDRLYKVGNKLVADFVGMPAKIYDLVKAGAYKRVSSEIFVNMKIGDKLYPFALKAVALLGGETPAVQTLDDVKALYADMEVVRAYETEAEVKVYSFDSGRKEAPMPENKKTEAPAAETPAATPEVKEHALPGQPPAPFPVGMQPHPGMAPGTPPAPGGGPVAKCANCARMEQELMAMKSHLGGMPRYAEENTALKAELETAKSDLGKSREELNKVYSEKRKAEVKATVDKFVQDKKVLPSQSALLETILLTAKESGERKFKIGDKELGSEELVLQFVSAGGAGLPTAPVSENGKSSAILSALSNPDDGKAMDEAVKEFMSKTGEKSYTKAYIAVAREIAEKQSPEKPA